MTPAQYQGYLKSPTWQTMRLRILRRAKYACERCGAKRPLDVHHKIYELGHEKTNDLEALCRPCHQAEHGIWSLERVLYILSRIWTRVIG